jgi:hypothetical protein
LAGFGLALAIYIIAYAGDAWLRHRKGAWEVSFEHATNGEPSLVVTQKALGISNVRITFAGEVTTNSGTVIFDRPQKPIPYGAIQFEDLTFLPGSVVLHLFSHEIELLPRTLYLNKTEHPWVNGTNYVLRPGEKLSPERLIDPRSKKRKRL